MTLARDPRHLVAVAKAIAKVRVLSSGMNPPRSRASAIRSVDLRPIAERRFNAAPKGISHARPTMSWEVAAMFRRTSRWWEGYCCWRGSERRLILG
jgi:hypothetical protein